MFRKIIYAVCFVSILSLAGFVVLAMNQPENKGETAPDSLWGPVLLELFTSQGCSSCPSADKLLRRLAQDPEYRGRIVPLAFHVDYWNYLGWKDPYADGTWTKRQGDYTESLGEATMYTPQLIVQGQAAMVGSNERAVVNAIDEHTSREASQQFRVAIHELRRKEAELVVSVSIEPNPSVNIKKGTVLAALFENGLSTEVPAGENRGRTLTNDFVVRSLQRVGKVNRKNEETKMYEMAFDMADQWNPHKMGVAVWIQEEQTMEIIGVGVELPREQ